MAASAINSVAGYGFPPPVSSSSSSIRCSSPSPLLPPPSNQEEEQKKQKSRAALVVHTPSCSSSSRRRRDWSLPSSFDHSDIIPLQLERDWEDRGLIVSASASDQVACFAFQGGDVAGFSSSSSTAVTSLEENKDGGGGGGGGGQDDLDRLVDRTINATVALAAGTFAITKLLTIDHDYWHGWTLFEILRYAPQHNWTAYEDALKTNPVLAKMMISGIVYSLGDWIAQCYEGKPLFEIDRARIVRSGLVGFTLHGSLSHYYYHFCEALFPFEAWWVVPARAAFDQTIWAAIWNGIYVVALGFMRFESPAIIYREVIATFWPMLTAGWKLWPFAHLITYGVVPVEQRLLWVDCVELVWVTILSTYTNEKSEAKNSELVSETDAIS